MELDPTTVRPLHDPEEGVMNYVAFMSGSGTNVIEILVRQRALEEKGDCPFNIVGIFTDEPSKKRKYLGIAKDEGIPSFHHGGIDTFYKKHGFPNRTDVPWDLKWELREEFDNETYACIKKLGDETETDISGVILGGYMSLVTAPIYENFLTLNVHPAHLSIVDEEGSRRFTGDNAVYDAIIAGQKYVGSTVHLATEKADMGPILMQSHPMPVQLEGYALDQLKADDNLAGKIADMNQDLLKECGDWVIFPQTVEDVARGLFGKDKKGNIYHRKNTDEGWEPGYVQL